MDEKKKEFVAPEAEVVNFTSEDIITISAGNNGWGGDNNTEVWG